MPRLDFERNLVNIYFSTFYDHDDRKVNKWIYPIEANSYGGKGALRCLEINKYNSITKFPVPNLGFWYSQWDASEDLEEKK